MYYKIKGMSIQKKIIAISLCLVLFISGLCVSLLDFGSKADSLDDAINPHKNIKREINLKASSDGSLQITKPSRESNVVPMGTENKWTLFVYLLEPSYGSDTYYSFLKNLTSYYVGENITDAFDIIVQCAPSESTSIDSFTQGKQIRAQVTQTGYKIIETSEPSNMGDAATLYEFLDWGVANYASEHMMVHIMGSGSNSLDGRYGISEDGPHSDGLTIYEVEEAFARQSKNMTCTFDGIIFNEYESGLVEYANLLSPYVDKMVALSESNGTNVWDYSIISLAISENPDITFDEIAKIICDTYDYQCSLNSSGKKYVSDMTEAINLQYNSYEATSYGIALYDLAKVDALSTSINNVMHSIYSQLSKSSDLDTLKEFSTLSSIDESYELISECFDINILINCLNKLTKIKVDTSSISTALNEYVLYSRCGSESKEANKCQVVICMPLFGLDYEYYPADKMNFYRNLVVSPYILNTIDYLYATHWGIDASTNYKWETSKYYFEDNFGFIPSLVSIGKHEGDVSDEMYTAKSLNDATFFELFDQKYTEYKEFTSIWKNFVSSLDSMRWISLSKSQYADAEKYYANAFLEFKDIQKYWNAYNAAYLTTESGYIMLGEQTGVTIDNENGIMHSEFNYEWIMLSDGQFVKTCVEKNPNQTIYSVPVYMDDSNVNIRIEETITNNQKSITVLGVYDSKSENKICNLEKGMLITPIYDVFDIKNSEYTENANEIKMPWFVEYGEEYTVKGSDDFLYGLLPKEEVTCSFAIMKYNGNIYYDVSNIEPIEKACIIGYTENYTIGDNYNFEIMNKILRGIPLTEEIDLDKANDKIDTLSDALLKAHLPNDMTLYRGCCKSALGEYKNLPASELIGKTITDKAFLSTSTELSVAENFAEDLVIIINAKKDSHGLSLKAISKYSGEEEILFAKNQPLVITDAEEKDGKLYITTTLE